MAFDSKDTAAFKGVWVFCEQREGVIMSTSYQLLSEGRKLANDLGVELCGVVLGKDIKEDYLKALGGYGADKVYYCNLVLMDVATTETYTAANTLSLRDALPIARVALALGVARQRQLDGLRQLALDEPRLEGEEQMRPQQKRDHRGAPYECVDGVE